MPRFFISSFRNFIEPTLSLMPSGSGSDKVGSRSFDAALNPVAGKARNREAIISMSREWVLTKNQTFQSLTEAPPPLLYDSTAPIFDGRAP